MNRDGLEDLFEREVRDGNENYKLCCPFHDEITPSFLIHKDMGLAYCWGCGWSGTVVTAVKEYCNVSADTATKLVKDVLGFRLVEGILKRRETLDKRNQIPNIPESWLAPFQPKIHKSILERGLSVDILRASGSRYDSLNGGRQVFPHRDKRGTLVGAAGRSCAGQDPKWFFYWGYSKGRSLYYGATPYKDVNEAYPEKPLCESTVIVVEGVFDVLWFQQHGITNAMGILGSKPSKYQIAELRNYETVILALDNDQAGRSGQEKLYNSLKKSTKVRFVDWPEGVNDAMDMQGKDLWNLISQSSSILQRQLTRNAENSRTSSLRRTSLTETQLWTRYGSSQEQIQPSRSKSGLTTSLVGLNQVKSIQATTQLKTSLDT